MASITLNKPSGGSATISVPDDGLTSVHTLPAEGFGKVLGGAMYQYQGGNINYTSTSATATPLTLTYTPKSATSYLVVKYGMQINVYDAGSDGRGGETYIYRDGVSTLPNGFGFKDADCFVYINHRNPQSDYYHKMAGEQWILSGSTNPTTFTIYASAYNGGSLRLHAHDGVSFISVMEVSA